MSEGLDTWLDATSIQVTIQTTLASAYCVKVDRSRRGEEREADSNGGGREARFSFSWRGQDRKRGVVETSHEE